MINHFDTYIFQRSAVQSDSSPEFRKKVISLFKIPEKTQININELKSGKKKPEESVLYYMGRVEDTIAKGFPKLADGNLQHLSDSIFNHGLRDEELPRISAIHANGYVVPRIEIAASAMSIGKYQY